MCIWLPPARRPDMFLSTLCERETRAKKGFLDCGERKKPERKWGTRTMRKKCLARDRYFLYVRGLEERNVLTRQAACVGENLTSSVSWRKIMISCDITDPFCQWKRIVRKWLHSLFIIIGPKIIKGSCKGWIDHNKKAIKYPRSRARVRVEFPRG